MVALFVLTMRLTTDPAAASVAATVVAEATKLEVAHTEVVEVAMRTRSVKVVVAASFPITIAEDMAASSNSNIRLTSSSSPSKDTTKEVSKVTQAMVATPSGRPVRDTLSVQLVEGITLVQLVMDIMDQVAAKTNADPDLACQGTKSACKVRSPLLMD
jgi:hypothetical protein